MPGSTEPVVVLHGDAEDFSTKKAYVFVIDDAFQTKGVEK